MPDGTITRAARRTDPPRGRTYASVLDSAGIGTGGTLTGIAQALTPRSPALRVIGVGIAASSAGRCLPTDLFAGL